MFSLNFKRLFSRALPWATFLAAAQLLSAGVVYQFPLPTTNLNQAAGSNRTNASIVESSFGSVPFIVGDDFVLSATNSYVVDSLTVWAIANTACPSEPCSSGIIDALGTQFNSVSLYTGYTPDGGTTWTQVNTSAPNSPFTRAYYTGTTDYQTLNTPDTSYYPIYAITFSGLNWSVPAGQISYFAVGSSPIGSNTFAPSVSLDTDTSTYDPFLYFTMIGGKWTPTYQDGAGSISGFNGLSVVNVSIATSSAVPEPSTFGLLGLGIVGLVLTLHRRK